MREEIKNEQEIFQLFKNFIEFISDFIYKIHSNEEIDPKKYVLKINETLDIINKSCGTTFRLSKDDFPVWIHSELE